MLSSLVLFLGAGASRPFGIPTMKELVPLFKKHLESNRKGNREIEEQCELYNDITTTAQDAHSLLFHRRQSHVDLESVFSIIDGLTKGDPSAGMSYYPYYYYLSTMDDSARTEFLDVTGNFAEKTSAKVDIARRLGATLEDFLVESCIIKDDKMFDRLDIVFGDLFTKLGTREHALQTVGRQKYGTGNWVIHTTNYDTCVESFCEQSEIPYNDGFEWNSQKREQVPNWGLLGKPGFKLIKLHGSIVWIDKQGVGLTKQRVPAYRDLFGSRSAIGRMKFEGRRMIYPVDQKQIFLDPQFHLYYRLKLDLASSPRWIIIGYSFNDPIITQIFQEAYKQATDDLKNNPKVVIVHPEADRIKREKLVTFNDSVGFTLPITNRFGQNEGAGVTDDMCRIL